MQFYSFSQISDSERESILSKHKEVYNGYQTLQPQVKNTQPLYVQDFAKDKTGAQVNNDGSVTSYTNYRINESHVMDTCEQCGGGLTEGECTECGWKMEGKVDEEKIKGFDVGVELQEPNEAYKTGKLDDIYDEEDLNPSSDFDYVEGGGNDYGTFEKAHHMKTIKNEETATSNAPLSFGKHYDEIAPPYDFKSNGPVGDGGTLRQKNVYEQTVGGGNAPDFDVHWDEPAYDFVSDGPIEDTYSEPADDMDLDVNDVKPAYEFISNGAEGGGDVYPVNEEEQCEECWEKMESAFEDDEELDEQDVSGVQGIYGAAEKPYAFVSTGPGKAGPYQTHSWGGEELSSGFEAQSEDEDVYRVDDLEDDELDLDLTKFNPEDKSWEEITAYTGEDEFSFVNESSKEKFQTQQEKILEMIERMRRFN